jgi:hypothetical protein
VKIRERRTLSAALRGWVIGPTHENLAQDASSPTFDCDDILSR